MDSINVFRELSSIDISWARYNQYNDSPNNNSANGEHREFSDQLGINFLFRSHNDTNIQSESSETETSITTAFDRFYSNNSNILTSIKYSTKEQFVELYELKSTASGRLSYMKKYVDQSSHNGTTPDQGLSLTKNGEPKGNILFDRKHARITASGLFSNIVPINSFAKLSVSNAKSKILRSVDSVEVPKSRFKKTYLMIFENKNRINVYARDYFSKGKDVEHLIAALIKNIPKNGPRIKQYLINGIFK